MIRYYWRLLLGHCTRCGRPVLKLNLLRYWFGKPRRYLYARLCLPCYRLTSEGRRRFHHG